MALFKQDFVRSKRWWIAIGILLCATFYPTDLEAHYSESRNGRDNHLVVGVEEYGRHLNTIIPIVIAIALRDVGGLKQAAAIVFTGIVASHGPKRLLNDVEVMGTRLGERPKSSDSRHNMPSGHSTLASAGAYYTVRRYSHWLGLIVWPVLFLTMYARFMLDAHTVSATIAGAMTGILVAALFTRPSFRFRRLMVTLLAR
ncbi:MAG: phosphatase PAP2 family protein [Alphaproteobacteria bacterium]|nr:phosphatase PAP2 family protein [Alphaproteobacteria bacterium SS10]